MKIIVTDLKKCVGCHSCELACAISRSQAKTLLGALEESPKPAARVRVIAIGAQPAPMECRHCEDAPCAAACPTHALYRLGPEAPVFFNRDLCIGCSSCVLVCPFGAIRKADGGMMAKCILCWDRLEAGELPACVAACPNQARKLVEANRVAEDKLRKAAQALAGAEAGEGK